MLGLRDGPRVLKRSREEPGCLGPSSGEPLLSAAGEDARIRLWRIPPEGLVEVLTTPEAVLTGEVGSGKAGGGEASSGS